MRMVIINNLPWAIGLQWHPPVPRITRQVALASAQAMDPAFNIVSTRKKQMGFGITDTVEHWRKARSLAAFIPGMSSFLGVFTLRDVQGEPCWWIFARLNGFNLGMGDQVVTDIAEATKAINILRDLNKNSFLESVEYFTEEESVAWLSMHCKLPLWQYALPTASMQPLHVQADSSKFKGAMALAALVLVGSWGVSTYMDYQSGQRAMDTARMQAEELAKRKQAIEARPETHFTQDWQGKALPSSAARPCVENILSLPTAMAAWELQSATCTGRALVAVWAHTEGGDFLSLPVNARLQSPKIAHTRTLITGDIPLRPSLPYTSLPTQEFVRRFLYQLCQASGSKLRLNFAAPQKATVEKVEIVAPWSVGVWELSSISPMDIATDKIPTILAQLPGLTLESTHWQNDSWTFKGRIFAR